MNMVLSTNYMNYFSKQRLSLDAIEFSTQNKLYRNVVKKTFFSFSRSHDVGSAHFVVLNEPPFFFRKK